MINNVRTKTRPFCMYRTDQSSPKRPPTHI